MSSQLNVSAFISSSIKQNKSDATILADLKQIDAVKPQCENMSLYYSS